MLAAMEPSRPAFHPAGAGTLLAGTTAACIGCGALVGWAAGGVGYGMLAGAMIGVPAGVGAVYVRYKDSVYALEHAHDAEAGAPEARAGAGGAARARRRARRLPRRRLGRSRLGARRGALGRNARRSRCSSTTSARTRARRPAAGCTRSSSSSRASPCSSCCSQSPPPNEDLALPAILVFALAYTAELGLSLATYFGSSK